jgi:hypothetical protein
VVAYGVVAFALLLSAIHGGEIYARAAPPFFVVSTLLTASAFVFFRRSQHPARTVHFFIFCVALLGAWIVVFSFLSR